MTEEIKDAAVFGELALAGYVKDRECLLNVLGCARELEVVATDRKSRLAAGVLRQMCKERLREIPKEEEYVRDLLAKWRSTHE